MTGAWRVLYEGERAELRGGRRRGSSSAARLRDGDLTCDPGAEHGDDEQDTGDDDLRLCGDVEQAHDVLQRAEQEDSRDRAAERALAAVEVDTAEQDGRDDGQFESGGVVVAGAGVVQCPE